MAKVSSKMQCGVDAFNDVVKSVLKEGKFCI